MIWLAAPQDPAPFAFDLNGVISGGTGAGAVALIIWVIKLVLDRTVPSRSDTRANVSLVLEGLSNMVRILQEEKAADAKVLADKQARIEALETESETDYGVIRELRREITELNQRLALKDRHIATLINELRKFGVEVIGLEHTDDKLEILFPNPKALTGEIPTQRN